MRIEHFNHKRSLRLILEREMIYGIVKYDRSFATRANDGEIKVFVETAYCNFPG